jgi:CheY-like chemotaxis protein
MKRILIVDDEKEIGGLIKKKLEQKKYEAKTALSGKEALAICRSTKPDLILLDIAMPDMDGYQFCEQLRGDAEIKNIPVLFLTGKDFDPKGIIKRYKELGACGYITKPSTFEDLLEKIKEVIG